MPYYVEFVSVISQSSVTQPEDQNFSKHCTSDTESKAVRGVPFLTNQKGTKMHSDAMLYDRSR